MALSIFLFGGGVMVTVLQFIHLLSVVIWIGSIIFFSFVAAPAIFKMLPRETAGDLVAKIFPQYYKVGSLCGVLALLSLWSFSSGSTTETSRLASLGLMTLLSFFSALRIGPSVRRLKADLRAAEEGPDREEKQKQFSRLHGFSMILNMIVLLVGLIYLGLTSLKHPF